MDGPRLLPRTGCAQPSRPAARSSKSDRQEWRPILPHIVPPSARARGGQAAVTGGMGCCRRLWLRLATLIFHNRTCRSVHPSLVQASSHPSWQCGLPDAACAWQRIVAVAPCEPEARCLGERNLLIVDLLNQIVLRWDSDSDCSGLLASGGIDAVWFPSHDDRIAEACRAAGADTLDADAIRFVGRDQTGPLPPGDFLAVKAGVWPGARASARNADGSFSGGASQRAWIDANGYLVAWTKALFPGRAPLLAYLPDSDAGIAQGQVITYDSLELALIDAWAAGGNYLLAPDAAYRNALLRGDPAATAAWSQLGRTARWLKENQDLLRQPPLSTITVLVERGDTAAEIAALMFRQSGSPELVSTERGD